MAIISSSITLTENSEDKLSLVAFQKTYNDNLPSSFPKASLPLLRQFKKTYPALFKEDDLWTLERHRKKFMDWRPQRISASS